MKKMKEKRNSSKKYDICKCCPTDRLPVKAYKIIFVAWKVVHARKLVSGGCPSNMEEHWTLTFSSLKGGKRRSKIMEHKYPAATWLWSQTVEPPVTIHNYTSLESLLSTETEKLHDLEMDTILTPLQIRNNLILQPFQRSRTCPCDSILKPFYTQKSMINLGNNKKVLFQNIETYELIDRFGRKD